MESTAWIWVFLCLGYATASTADATTTDKTDVTVTEQESSSQASLSKNEIPKATGSTNNIESYAVTQGVSRTSESTNISSGQVDWSTVDPAVVDTTVAPRTGDPVSDDIQGSDDGLSLSAVYVIVITSWVGVVIIIILVKKRRYIGNYDPPSQDLYV